MENLFTIIQSFFTVVTYVSSGWRYIFSAYDAFPNWWVRLLDGEPVDHLYGIFNVMTNVYTAVLVLVTLVVLVSSCAMELRRAQQ